MKHFSLKTLLTALLLGIFLISCKKDEKIISIKEITTPNPTNNAVNVGIQNGTLISFEHDNSEDQDYIYEVYLDTISQPVKKVKDLAKYNYSFNTTDLLAGKTYYWQVICKNSSGITKESEIWKFSTTTTYYYPPTIGSWSQELVNEVGAKRYTCIDGAVSIDNEVNDLTPLRRITEITKSLSISIVSFTNLQGLENLKKIGNGLYIGNNTNLKSIAELKNVELINGPLVFDNNVNLGSISSLDSAKGNITSISIDYNPKVSKLPFLLTYCDTASSLNILNNPILNVSELKNLKVVTGKALVYVTGSGVLNGLEQLKEVKGDLVLATDGNTDMQDLKSLSSVGGDFMLWYSESLTSLSGLENLISIGGNLDVEDNPNLKSLSGLDNLNKAHSVFMRNNPKLTEYCALHKLMVSQNILWTNFYFNSDAETNLIMDDLYKNCGN
jgi:hypothetical protein